MIRMKDNIRNYRQSTESLYAPDAKDCWLSVNRYYAMNFDCFEMSPHMHDEFEIMYVVSGSCNIYSWTDDNKEELWQMKEGEYVIIDCNAKHQLDVAKGARCRMLNLEISLEPQYSGLNLQQLCEQSKSLQDFFEIPASIYKCYDDEGTIHTIMKELHKQLQNPIDHEEQKVMQNLTLAQLLVELGRQRAKKHRPGGGSKYVRRALSYLYDHYDKDIKIEDLSGKIGISPAYLQRIFKEQTGSTIVDKVNELRIEKAKLLLETSKLPITDIAVSVGFNNRQHFSYTFHKLTGCSPSVYYKHKGDYLILL